ncbi:hypothetical protein SUGI_0002310 [Cryptomeria japonica]|uniref:uncharacterized protein LOC131068214 isoform X2 n=1 Tax=Cryptomeria japonica TaxID=3369 RepID=UPI002408B64D|nr:uncharacterized protein LOC131068214 isoform X2 [Cryptomeria japonica]GLJ04739.1 hypothetical protein SUGI_0002310 [Cryptomeria japonica]
MATIPVRQSSLHSYFSPEQKQRNQHPKPSPPRSPAEDPSTPNAVEIKRKRPDPPMTEYERQREENIRKKNEFLEKLGIPAQLQMLQKATARQPRFKPPKPPKPQVPLRRSTRRCPQVISETLVVPETPPDRTPDLSPLLPQDYDDSSVFKYICSATTSDGGLGTASAADSGSCLVGYRQVGKTLADRLLTRIYSVDVAALDGSHNALVAAGGHGGRISVYGTSICSEDCGEEGPLMTWKASSGWISGVKFLRRQVSSASAPLLLSSCNDGRLIVWDIGKEQQPQVHLAAPPIVAQLDDLHSRGIFGIDEFNGRIATVSKDSSVGFCSFMDSAIVTERSFSGHHYGPVRGICFRNADILADCGADNRICVLDLRLANSCTLTIESNHRTGVNVVEWCPNQEFLILSASKDPELLLYDIRSCKEPLHKLEGHVDPIYKRCSQIYRPAFVANGMAVATPGQGSRQISLYSTSNGRALSRGFVGYDANLVMCNVKHRSSSQRVWLAGKQITQLFPVWQDSADVCD